MYLKKKNKKKILRLRNEVLVYIKIECECLQSYVC